MNETNFIVKVFNPYTGELGQEKFFSLWHYHAQAYSLFYWAYSLVLLKASQKRAKQGGSARFQCYKACFYWLYCKRCGSVLLSPGYVDGVETMETMEILERKRGFFFVLKFQ